MGNKELQRYVGVVAKRPFQIRGGEKRWRSSGRRGKEGRREGGGHKVRDRARKGKSNRC